MLKKLKDFLVKALCFLRLTDDGNRLSITYIACWVVITKIAMEPSPSITEMGGLLVVLAAHYGKKHLNKGKIATTSAQTDQITKMQTKLDNMADKVGAVATTLGFSKKS